jgi:hypothetical protein
MKADNIKRFNQLAGSIFSDLYKSFPVPTDLELETYVADSTSYDEHLQMDVPNDGGEFFYACIDWLADAGYLRYAAKYTSEGFAGCVLTTKGLEVLKAVPDSIKAGESLGDQLVEASKSGAKSALGDIAGQAISAGVRIVSSHFGLPI